MAKKSALEIDIGEEEPLESGTRRERKRAPNKDYILPRPPGIDPENQQPALIKEVIPFLKYWKSLCPKWNKSFRVYLYRKYPYCNLKLAGLEHNYLDTWEDWPFGDINDALQQLTERFGSGEYKFMMTDLEAAGRECATVTHWAINNPDYPPNIILDTLIVGPKVNEPYVRLLRMQNKKVPGDPDYKYASEMEKEMADNAINNRIMERVVDKAFAEPAVVPVVTPVPNTDVSGFAQAVSDTIKVVQSGAEASIQMVKDIAEESRNRQQQTADPMEMFGKVAGLLKDIAPDNTAMLKLIIDQNTKMHEAEMLRMHAELSELKELLKAREGKSENSFMEELQKYQALQQILGNGRRAAPVVEERGTDWGAIITGVVQSVAPMIAQAMAARDAAAQPPQQQQQAPTVAGQTTVTVKPKFDPALNQELIAEIGEARTVQLFSAYSAILKIIEVPLTKHIITAYKGGTEEDRQYSQGEDFALWVINGYGDAILGMAKQNGEEALHLGIKAYRPIMDQLKLAGVTDDQLKEFVHRFFVHDEMLLKRDEEEEDES